MDTALVHLFKHNRWANLRLLEACAELGDELFESSAVGTYGSVGDTLVHLLAAEERYSTLLTGTPPRHPLKESDDFPGIDELRIRARRSGDALVEVAVEDPSGQILEATYQGEMHQLPAAIVLVQVINHGNEHRAQVMTSMTQAGVQPPDLSGWSYNEEALLADSE